VKPIRLLYMLLIVNICTLALGQEALVRIYATVGGGRHQGTGFFTTNHGQIVTAYHVVEGARAIEVTSEHLGLFTNIRVDSVSTEYDLAVLQVLNSGVTPFIKTADYSPDTRDDLQVQGYPLGDPYQMLRAYTTRSGLVQTKEYNNMSGERLFNRDIQVIPLGAIIFSGMSGGPVLYNGQAIGVLSGSYVQGGSIAWAIPAKYLYTHLQQVNLKPYQISKWEALQLMDSSSWKSLRGMVLVNAGAAAMSDAFSDNVEALAQTYADLYKQAMQTRQDIEAYRPVLERVATDPLVARDPQASADLLAKAGNPLVESIDRFSELCDQSGREGGDISQAMINLGMWIADESHVDKKTGQALARKMTAIVNQHRDIIHGVDAYLNMDRQPLAQAGAALASAMSRSRSPADEARALLAYLDVVQPYVNAFATPRALIFMSSAIGTFRQIGELLEPVVYQTKVTR
jgi:Trypsin-like peptidase domain